MKRKYIKAGIISIVLIVPVLVILFLNGFGKNFHKLPVYFAIDSTKVEGGYVVTEAHTIPDFQFYSQNNQIISNKDLNGYIYVTDFFFTRCPGICPKMSNQMVRIQEEFMNDDDVKIVSFTVDPLYDSVPVLQQYAADYKARPDKWYFLTGAKDSIYTLAQKGFFITAMEDRDRPLEFIHSEKFVLVDKKGWIRGYYDGTDPKDVDRLITEIKVLQKIYADNRE
ncbi:MAG TPA: SCO family protein [Cytophagaceae bacterium]